jgi:micrococcal nuclease
MFGIFLLLFLTSGILLIVGLIRPSIFQRIIKRVPSRKNVFFTFCGLTIFSFIMMGVTAQPVEKKVNSDLSQSQTQNSNQIINEPQSVSTTTINITTTTANLAVATNNEVKTSELTVAPSQPVNEQPQTVPNSQPVQNQDTSMIFYPVSSVVDGDTVKINVNGTIETFRLIGMDTPEVVDPRKTVQCFGKEASDKAKELLNGKKVRIEKDATQGDLDKYGRHLAYIYREDGLFYNKYMIEQGYAHEYTYNTPYKYQVEFKAAQKSAEENQRGLWSPNTCNGDTTQSATTTTVSPTPTVDNNVNSQPTQAGKYYTSSYYSSKYYYPESCDGWKNLTPKYLTSFNTLEALLKSFPNRIISPTCQ